MNFLSGLGTLRLYRHMPVLAKTEAAKKELENLGAHDITIAPVGLNPHVLRKDHKEHSKEELRSEYGFKADEVLLCSVARLETDKRTVNLIEVLDRAVHRAGADRAAAEHGGTGPEQKDFRLLIVGKGPLREQVDQKIRECGLEDRVTILDRVPFDDMWKIYRMSDYYINMSTVEIFGMAVMEAVYYGASVAARRALGPNLTLNGLSGHCLCECDEDIVEWICGPYPSDEDLDESSRKILADFSWRRCAEAFLSKIRTSH
jgi:1,2-diacylglycerol 3-alpha-glucosyltransferase